MADYGADVVRVDRRVQPFGPKDSLVRGKRSVVLDLKDERLRALFLELVKAADVLIEPYRPGVMDRLQLGPTTLRQMNPRLIYAQLSGYRPGSFYGEREGSESTTSLYLVFVVIRSQRREARSSCKNPGTYGWW